MLATEALPVWPAVPAPAIDAELDRAQCADPELARRVAGGDVQAFEELYQRHHRRVYGLCLRMTRNVAEAEDLTQEVFIHLYRKIGSFRGEAAFTTWLHRLTTNQVLMHFRKTKARREQATEDGMMPVPAIETSTAARRLPLLDQVTLQDAIAQLPPGYRMVFILHDVMGYEHEEIGRILGCADGTSKSQLHKARMKLRKLLTVPADKVQV